jgi:hypothetical protein
MSATPDTLILFTRYPEPGTVKTRLIPVLGAAGAAEFHRRLAESTAAAVKQAGRLRQLTLEVRFDGGDASPMRDWLGPEFRYRPQGEGDIGARMRRSLQGAFDDGAGRALLVGSDIPGLSSATILNAYDALTGADLVFGPAEDGGYYLIGAGAEGFRRGTPYLDSGIEWGSSRVLAQTIKSAQTLGLNCRRVETLADVDRPEDLGAAVQALGKAEPTDSLSVIIPALNEAALIADTLAAASKDPHTEIIVVDGQSTDPTPDIAAASGARVLRAMPPRSVQMNAGAAAARGAYLLFLHADTRLPPDFAAQARRTLAVPGAVAGAFRLKIGSAAPGLRLIERVANWRSRWLQLPYGDQAIFLTRASFWRTGGFRPLPIMEDYDLMRRLRRHGSIRMAPGFAVTSARRWQQLGILKTWLINQQIIAAYALGIPAERLSAWYRARINPAGKPERS